ncbi:MAG: hypothetical protein DMG47_05265 [Acidobacteria bacterium]|nr:MAG: hypothetical protein DMG47_05265 [Acidobacteriota bacterium]
MPQPRCRFQQRRRIQEVARLQHRARPFDAFQPALRIDQRTKSQLAPRAEPLGCLANQRKHQF